MNVTEEEMKAHEIRVSQTRSLLAHRFSDFLAAVSKGSYAFWLGSGISREKLDAVPVFVLTVLAHLQSSINLEDPTDPNRLPLQEALGLAGLSADEKKHIDLSSPIETWAIRDALVERISRRYSELLDIEVPNARRDFLLWDVLDVPGRYGAGSSDPDLEHYCLAVLIMEGVAPDIVTANWDGLIEKAVEELAPGNDSILSVYVRSLDFREPRGRSRLLKFHGCAVLAIDNPAEYRDLLVGRRTQITDWPRDDDHSLMRREMTTIIITKPTLMIGLSAQDNNIQDLFAAAKEVLPWTWPAHPSAFVFAEDAIGQDQRNILRVGYRSTYEGNEIDIARGSHVRAFAKPLLSALVIAVWAKKMEVLAGLTDPSKNAPYLEKVATGISALADVAAIAVDGDMVAASRRLISDVGRAMTLLRSGRAPAVVGSYSPVGNVPVHQIADDPSILTSGLPEAALALSILGSSLADGTLTLACPRDSADESRPVLFTESDGFASRIFFAASATAAVELLLSGLVDDTDPQSVLIHSATPPAIQQRTPSSAPGRTGRRAARHIDMADLKTSSSSYEEIQQGFREGFGA